jgi:hypothetical protein
MSTPNLTRTCLPMEVDDDPSTSTSTSASASASTSTSGGDVMASADNASGRGPSRRRARPASFLTHRSSASTHRFDHQLGDRRNVTDGRRSGMSTESDGSRRPSDLARRLIGILRKPSRVDETPRAPTFQKTGRADGGNSSDNKRRRTGGQSEDQDRAQRVPAQSRESVPSSSSQLSDSTVRPTTPSDVVVEPSGSDRTITGLLASVAPMAVGHAGGPALSNSDDSVGLTAPPLQHHEQVPNIHTPSPIRIPTSITVPSTTVNPRDFMAPPTEANDPPRVTSPPIIPFTTTNDPLLDDRLRMLSTIRDVLGDEATRNLPAMQDPRREALHARGVDIEDVDTRVPGPVRHEEPAIPLSPQSGLRQGWRGSETSEQRRRLTEILGSLFGGNTSTSHHQQPPTSTSDTRRSEADTSVPSSHGSHVPRVPSANVAEGPTMIVQGESDFPGRTRSKRSLRSLSVRVRPTT